MHTLFWGSGYSSPPANGFFGKIAPETIFLYFWICKKDPFCGPGSKKCVFWPVPCKNGHLTAEVTIWPRPRLFWQVGTIFAPWIFDFLFIFTLRKSLFWKD